MAPPQFMTLFAILDILESYGEHTNPEAPIWKGKFHFLPHVHHFVRQHLPVQLTIPAFPCKSANRITKVLGALPDFGEELALQRLNEMAEDIRNVYNPGAPVNIASDGILFNEMLGITDEDIYDYSEALEKVIRDQGFNNIRFTSYINLHGLENDNNMSRAIYLATAPIYRQELDERFGPSPERLNQLIKEDIDTLETYRGMVHFLESELEFHPSITSLSSNEAKKKERKRIAREMMRFSTAFNEAIKTARPHDVRLAIHPSTGAAKLSISLIPAAGGGHQKSPWHSCVAVGLDGNYRCVHKSEVRDTHELIYRNGRPWYYQESRIEPWLQMMDMQVVF